MSGPAQLPVDEWEFQNKPGAVREVYAVGDDVCIHGVPLQLGCRYCQSRPRPPVRFAAFRRGCGTTKAAYRRLLRRLGVRS